MTSLSYFKPVLALAVVGALSGCSAVITSALATSGSDEDNLRKATAQYFSTTTGNVRISDVSRGALATGYKARVRGVLYNCGYTFGSVECKRPGQ